jgi:ABC-type oligopeptide transport system ATPase subunit
MPASERELRVRKLLQRVELPEEAMYRYPHEFSGGQRQRICIARALAVEPKVIICDEPTSALDVSVQSQIIQLLKTLQVEQGMSYLFITHDLAVVSEIADEVAVMYRGKIVEQGAVAHILTQPQHAYTQKLMSAIPCAVN